MVESATVRLSASEQLGSPASDACQSAIAIARAEGRSAPSALRVGAESCDRHAIAWVNLVEGQSGVRRRVEFHRLAARGGFTGKHQRSAF